MCLREGKEKVIERLEEWHKRLEWQEACAWEDPATYAIARRLGSVLTKQAETLIRLKMMSEEDMRALLVEGNSGLLCKEGGRAG
jgi:hypothetical protein